MEITPITVLENMEVYKMNPRKHNMIVLGILSFVCVILIVATSIKDKWIEPHRVGVGYILTPIQVGVNLVGRQVYEEVETRGKLKNALEENAKLKAQIDTLTSDNIRLQAESFELQRLRELYKLDSEYLQYETVAARVIAKDSGGWFRVFRINKGAYDGIKKDMNVIAGGGLVGIVTDVGTNYSTVRAIIDDLSRVSAMAMQTGDSCMVSGDIKLYQEGKIKLTDVKLGSELKDGDKIVTSNISTKYVPGILIGYASDIKDDENRLTKSGYIIPVAKFDTLQEVLIITKIKETKDAQ